MENLNMNNLINVDVADRERHDIQNVTLWRNVLNPYEFKEPIDTTSTSLTTMNDIEQSLYRSKMDYNQNMRQNHEFAARIDKQYEGQLQNYEDKIEQLQEQYDEQEFEENWQLFKSKPKPKENDMDENVDKSDDEKINVGNTNGNGLFDDAIEWLDNGDKMREEKYELDNATGGAYTTTMSNGTKVQHQGTAEDAARRLAAMRNAKPVQQVLKTEKDKQDDVIQKLIHPKRHIDPKYKIGGSNKNKAKKGKGLFSNKGKTVRDYKRIEEEFKKAHPNISMGLTGNGEYCSCKQPKKNHDSDKCELCGKGWFSDLIDLVKKPFIKARNKIADELIINPLKKGAKSTQYRGYGKTEKAPKKKRQQSEKQIKRGKLISQLMKEKKMTLGQASKYIKENNLV